MPPAAKRFVLVLLALAALTGLGPIQGRPTASALAQTGGRVVIYGYPYAARCPEAGYDDDVVDRWGMYVCNCTSYVAWALRANGQRTDWFIRGAMNAWNWPHVAQLAHLRVSSRPRARTVAVWPKAALPFGHVAYVTGVERDGGIDVSEYNLPEASVLGPFTFDVRRDVRPSGAVFIHVPERPTSRV